MTLLPLFVTCPRGVEPLLKAELERLGAQDCGERPGGVSSQASRETAYRICLWSRLASRVLMPLSRFELKDADSLYAGAQAVDWPDLFAVQRRFAIEVAGRSAAVTHTHYAGLKVKDAIADRFRAACGERPNVDTETPDIRVHLHLDRDHATLSLDLGGDALHRRGYRTRAMEAPLKETLAAALLLRMDWPARAAEGLPFWDPMCGSGTLVIEAALMAADIAPNGQRTHFGFEAWEDHIPAVLTRLREEAIDRGREGRKQLPRLIGSDTDGRALRVARDNARRAGFGEAIEWRQADALAVLPDDLPPGALLTNPPYGERLSSEADIIKLYSLLGAHWARAFGGWQAGLFTGRPDLAPRLGLRAHAIHALYNGALPAKLLQFHIPHTQSAGALSGGEDFANRFAKNLKHLRKWAKRSEVDHYRLYDADLPDYALAVDLYATPEPRVHVQEYAAPKSIDPVKAERRLRQALSHIQQQLDLPADHLHYKVRKAQKGDSQYQRQGEQGHFFTIVEHGVKLAINLDDYLDTGVFLDHRPMRLRLQREAAGTRFLNLFCYTGAATAHAVAGGALQSVSVDLSNTYLDWAVRNLQLNGVRMPDAERRSSSANPHRLFRADCLAWLQEQADKSRPPQFDLIFCDPPTFSNSKKMDGTLDVQRDHVGFLLNALKLLAPGGTLYFSTNRRGFKLDPEAFGAWTVTDITRETLDEDFKRPPPAHRAWQFRDPRPKAAPPSPWGR
jgi:23S rRNA (guanine2445-N2)-methyltransferase / 23S rRNA (guanine2069-N7)-methyltransferase